MKVYKIRDWDLHFETAQSRTVKNLGWVAMPLKHDGLGFRRLMGTSRGVSLYGAWVLIVQVAAKCPLRGTLADERGPFTPEDLHLKTGAPIDVFEEALEVLSSERVAWLLVEHCESADSAPSVRQPTVQDSTDSTGQNKTLAPAEAGFPLELLTWIAWWNGLRAEGLVPAGVDSDPPSQAVLRGWARVRKSAELRKLFADRDAIDANIRRSTFCRKGWFRLEKLLGGVNREGELIIRKLLDGAYIERSSDGKSERVGPGQKFMPGVELGDV